jgi:hypothetical protein
VAVDVFAVADTGRPDVERTVLGVAQHDGAGIGVRRGARERQRRGRQPWHVEHGDVTARVIDDDAGGELSARGDDTRLGRPGNDVRVGEHVLGRVDEARAFDAPRTGRCLAVDLEDGVPDRVHRRRLQQCRIRRPDVDDARALQVAEHRREATAVDEPPQRRVDIAHRSRHHPVDVAHDRRPANCRRQRRVRRGRQGHGHHPRYEQHGHDAERRADAGVERLRLPPGDALAKMPGAPHREQLAGHRHHEDAHDRDRYLRLPSDQVRTERPGQLRAQRRAAEEADQREETDHRAVAETAYGIADRREDDDPIHERHSDQFGKTTRVPVIPCA